MDHCGHIKGLGAHDSGHPDSIFADIRVRRAIAHAIDNEAIAKAVGHGYYEPVNQFALSTSSMYNPEAVGYPYNPQKAKELLAEAGYPNGFETKITFRTGSEMTDLFTAVQGYLGEVGIEVKLNAADRGLFRQTISEGWNNHLVAFTITQGRGLDPVSQMLSHLSSTAFTYDPESVYIPAEYQAQLDKMVAEHDPKQVLAQFHDLMKILIDDYCMAIPVIAPYNFTARSTEVGAFDMHEYGMAEWRPEEAWLKK